MATLQTRCLLSIFLVNLPRCVPLRDAPALSNPPFCHRPCDVTQCSRDIQCQWSPSPGDQTRTKYSLHWKGLKGNEQNSSNNIIGRERFNIQEDLRVWVEAKNQNGSAKSPEVVLNPADICQPPPPIIEQDQDEAFQICWESVCEKLDLLIGTCSVQYRTEVDRDWREEEGFYRTYTVEEPQLCTVYDFRVRCGCGSSLTTDWSAILTMQGKDKSPEGELDVWRDCDPTHVHNGCILIWKRLPVSQACGSILGYEITLDSARLKFPSSELKNNPNCSEVRCHFAIERTAAVSVSAYNAEGATKPSDLKWLGSGEEENTPALRINIVAENLTVSWNPFSQLPDNLKAYVVQYKQYDSGPGQSFDWVRLNRSQTTAFFRGQFKNYTAYQVSLFTLSASGEVHHISSALGYFLQKVPSRVPSFGVSSLGNSEVYLQWEPVPVPQQYGLMQYYEIGVHEKKGTYKVYNLSARTYKLEDLSPGKVYNVWMRAVNAAGPGENTTRKFTTKEREDFDVLPTIFTTCLIILICGVCILGIFAKKQGFCKSKVPDPNNSQIFRDMKHQTSDSMTWICILLSEPHPTMSSLEIVTSKSPQDLTSDTEERQRDGSVLLGSQDIVKEDSVPEECRQEDNRCVPEAYRKIVDSDEEDMNSSDEEQDTTGYERHFMPTVIDMLEVSS